MIRQRIKEHLNRLLQEHDSPARLAVAVFAGCMVGVSPFLGLHFALCLLIAMTFRLNKVVMYLAANISLPPLIPLVGFASIQLGEKMLHGHWLALNLAQFRGRPGLDLAGEFFVSWLIGALPLGAALGLVTGGGAYLWLRRRKPAAAIAAELALEKSIRGAIRRAMRRYRGTAPQFYYYAQFKPRLDPCYEVIAAMIGPESLTVDLGCGQGILPLVLAELGGGRRVVGVELDAKKIAVARHAGRGDFFLKSIEWVEGDLLKFPLPACDTVVLLDILHYFDPEVQQNLLRAAYAALKPGGRLLIRENDRARTGLAAYWTRSTEFFAVRIGWNRVEQVAFRPAAALLADLVAAGFNARAEPLAGPLYPGNVLIVAGKPAGL